MEITFVYIKTRTVCNASFTLLVTFAVLKLYTSLVSMSCCHFFLLLFFPSSPDYSFSWAPHPIICPLKIGVPQGFIHRPPVLSYSTIHYSSTIPTTPTVLLSNSMWMIPKSLISNLHFSLEFPTYILIDLHSHSWQALHIQWHLSVTHFFFHICSLLIQLPPLAPKQKLGDNTSFLLSTSPFISSIYYLYTNSGCHHFLHRMTTSIVFKLGLVTTVLFSSNTFFLLLSRSESPTNSLLIPSSRPLYSLRKSTSFLRCTQGWPDFWLALQAFL